MKGDFSRFTFDHKKHYNRVLMQQGRVQLDNDFNVQSTLDQYRNETGLRDCIGASGMPADEAGYGITFQENNLYTRKAVSKSQYESDHTKPPEKSDSGGSEIWIGQGRAYVAGILCENATDLRFTQQPDFPDAALPLGFPHHAPTLFYLDVWSRFITALEAPELREVALGGPDTTGRSQTVAAVKHIGAAEAESFFHYQNQVGHLKARHNPQLPVVSNSLFRVEIHTSGKALATPKTAEEYPLLKVVTVDSNTNQVQIEHWEGGEAAWSLGQAVQFSSPEMEKNKLQLTATICGRDLSKKRLTFDQPLTELAHMPHVTIRQLATFKWSAENGIVAFPLDQAEGTVLHIHDHNQGYSLLTPGDWVEVVNDDLTLKGMPGPLRQIESFGDIGSGNTFPLTLNQPLPDHFETAPNQHPIVRLWDQKAQALPLESGAVPLQEDTWLDLKNGVQIYFEKGGTYHHGHYWWIPTRTENHGIEWPTDTNGQALAQPPQGVVHHFAPLAKMTQAHGKPTIQDVRPIFRPLTEVLKNLPPHAAPVPEQTKPPSAPTHDTLPSNTISETHIQPHTITADKLAFEPNALPVGSALLQERPQAPSGFVATGMVVTTQQTHPQWQSLATPMPEAGAVKCGVVKDKIYVFFESGDVWEFAPQASHHAWTKKTAMLPPLRSAYDIAVLNDKIYVVGGYEGHDQAVTGRNEVYDPEANTWATKSALPTPRSHLSVGASDGKLYAMGGLKKRLVKQLKTTATQTNEQYDPIQNEWKEVAALPAKGYGMAVTACQGGLFCLGGKTTATPPFSDRNYWYSALGDRWQPLPAIPMPMDRPAVAIVGQRLYLFGSTTHTEGTVSEALVYDLASQIWSRGIDHDLPKSLQEICVSQGAIYSLGGVLQQKKLDTIEVLKLETVFHVFTKSQPAAPLTTTPPPKKAEPSKPVQPPKPPLDQHKEATK